LGLLLQQQSTVIGRESASDVAGASLTNPNVLTLFDDVKQCCSMMYQCCGCCVAEHLYWEYLVQNMADWIKTETIAKLETVHTDDQAFDGMFIFCALLCYCLCSL